MHEWVSLWHVYTCRHCLLFLSTSTTLSKPPLVPLLQIPLLFSRMVCITFTFVRVFIYYKFHILEHMCNTSFLCLADFTWCHDDMISHDVASIFMKMVVCFSLLLNTSVCERGFICPLFFCCLASGSTGHWYEYCSNKYGHKILLMRVERWLPW